METSVFCVCITQVREPRKRPSCGKPRFGLPTPGFRSLTRSDPGFSGSQDPGSRSQHRLSHPPLGSSQPELARVTSWVCSGQGHYSPDSGWVMRKPRPSLQLLQSVEEDLAFSGPAQGIQLRAQVRSGFRLTDVYPSQLCLEKYSLLSSTLGLMVSLPGFQPAGQTSPCSSVY